jgi:hypothetical protein
MASAAAWSLYCNRILIVNNSLFVQAQQKNLKSTPSSVFSKSIY